MPFPVSGRINKSSIARLLTSDGKLSREGFNLLVQIVDRLNRIDDGILTLRETTTPVAIDSYGRVYTKADNKCYFQDGAGNEHEIAFV